uniref:Serine incorporator n=1 Tax=Prasinoderma singulare TaxID=676789 RepID=A0A7S3FG74_9VIRI
MFAMGTCAASAAASAASYCACAGVRGCLGVGAKMARAMYVTIFTVSMVLAWALRDYAKPLVSHLPWAGGESAEGWCGEQAVLRLSAATAVFFLFLAACTAGAKTPRDSRSAVHTKGWGLKLFAWLALSVGAFFLPVEALSIYGEAARAGSAVFLLVQVLILLDFAYEWNESWVAKDDDRWFAALFGVCCVCYLVAVGLGVVSFVFFSHCSINVFFTSVSFLLMFVTTAASLHPAAHNGSLLPAAVVSLYAMYLNFTAMTSEPDECNGLPGASTSQGMLAAGLAVTLLSVVYSALRAGSSQVLSTEGGSGAATEEYEALQDREDRRTSRRATGADDSDDDEEEGGARDDEDREEDDEDRALAGVPYNYAFFHLIFACAAMYYAMLMTGWGDLSEHQEKDTINVGWPSVWVKIISEWGTVAIYMWTLVAPMVFPDREF